MSQNLKNHLKASSSLLKTNSTRFRRKLELIRLKRIRKKKVPQYTYCKNCGTRLEGMYCHQCGQYALDTEQPFWKYIRQYFENVYQFDTKIWHTLWLMFTRPGLLTSEFNAGKINSYVHPFRLYMCISVVFFAVFFMLMGERVSDITNINGGLINKKIISSISKSDPESLPDTTIYLYQAPQLVKTLSLRFGLKNADSIIRYQLVDNAYGLARTTLPRILADSCLKKTEIMRKDLEYISRNKAKANLNIENWIDGKDYGPENVAAIKAFKIDSINIKTAQGKDSIALLPQDVYIWNDNQHKDAETDSLQKEKFSNSILGSLSKWTPFFMMFLLPVFALMLRVLYRKLKMPYMWHFVHAIHINTVFLILICIPLIPIFAYGIDDLLANQQTLTIYQQKFMETTLIAFPLLIYLYMLISFHEVYRQGWIKTIVKSAIFFISFSFIAILLALILFIWLLMIESESI